ncbi:DUF1007 family protein [Chthonobacter rhizosphaerae]|uniref:DUF1007 family protein n=1 Tax=Chthonobacter rhizosphaerae TaxID=2735553 RepID=UPI0015EE44C4|nr:DUF1007 family protein [Chthonobacter rhizosphaerae]
MRFMSDRVRGWTRRSSPAVLLAACSIIAVASPAGAHPHVFVDAKAEMVFDASGKVTAIRNVWRFDDAYSAFASQGLDADGDGKLSVEELKPLADVNVESLKDFAYFTFLAAGDRDIDFDAPTEYWIQWDEGFLTLYFTLPTKGAVEIRGLPAKLEVYDPTYYVAFNFVETEPVALDNAPKGCTLEVIRPQELDAATAATLAEIPPDQREIPDELAIVTQDLTNGASVRCP